MNGDNIQDHGNAILMALIHQILKTVRLSVAGGRTVKSCLLIAP